MSQPHLPVVYNTHFCGSGWGKRALEESELALAFELPDFVGWESKFLTEIVPLQMLRSVMDAVLGQLTPGALKETQSPVGKRRKLEVAAIDPTTTVLPGVPAAADRHWLPTLNRWLSGSWTDAPIADKAVKANGAVINVITWHNRIQLVLPWCRDRQLRTMERACMRRWRRQVTLSFTAFLSTTYGANWVEN